MNNYDTCQKNLAGRNRMEDLFSVCGKIRLRKGEGRTLKAGGAWVYDNEIEWMSDGIIDGHLVEVLDFDDYFMGIGFINRKSKITVRMLARHTDVVDEAFIEEKMCIRDRRCCSCLDDVTLVKSELNFTCYIFLSLLNECLKSVSYTHLDVYKRQSYMFIAFSVQWTLEHC